MEKLETTLKEKNLISKKVPLKKLKNKELIISKKIINFLLFMKQNRINFYFSIALTTTCIFLICFIFLKSDYYNFLNRPKVLENSLTIIIFFVLFVTLSLLSYIVLSYNEFNNRKEKKQKVSQVNQKIFEKNFLQNDEDSFSSSQKNQLMESIKNNSIKNNFSFDSKERLCKIFFSKFKTIFYKSSFFSFAIVPILILLFLFFFQLKVLWLCVFFLFFVIFSTFKKIFVSKGWFEKAIFILNFSFALVIFLSFYLIFLLN